MEAVAKLKNYPTSPRKMRLLADEIRGMQVEKALALLEERKITSLVVVAGDGNVEGVVHLHDLWGVELI